MHEWMKTFDINDPKMVGSSEYWAIGNLTSANRKVDGLKQRDAKAAAKKAGI